MPRAQSSSSDIIQQGLKKHAKAKNCVEYSQNLYHAMTEELMDTGEFSGEQLLLDRLYALHNKLDRPDIQDYLNYFTVQIVSEEMSKKGTPVSDFDSMYGNRLYQLLQSDEWKKKTIDLTEYRQSIDRMKDHVRQEQYEQPEMNDKEDEDSQRSRKEQDSAQEGKSALSDSEARDKMSAMIHDAQLTAEDIRIKARQQAEQIKKNARILVDSATQQAYQIRIEAEQDADKIRKEAEQDADKIRKEAEETADKIRKEAEKGAEECAKRYLKQQIIANTDDDIQINTETVVPTTSVEGLKDMARNATLEIQRELGKQILDYKEKMDSLKYGIEDLLDAWRRKLYEEEFGDLARYYQTLYNQIGENSQIVKAIALQIEILENNEQKGTLETVFLNTLCTLRSNLSRNLQSLENILSGFGLIIDFPAEGEPFSEDRHLVANSYDEAIGADAVIDYVQVPGVCVVNQNGFPDWIRKAVVYLKAESMENEI